MTRRTVYPHGLPGSPAELSLAGPGRAWLDPDRVFAPGRATGDLHRPEVLAQRIREWAGGEPVSLVGFSLGGAMALRLAPLLGEQVLRIDLIAPAAPLNLGEFLPQMAGGAVFGMARDHPRLFALLCRVQGLAARFAPALLVKALLADTRGGDAALARDPAFRALLASILRETFASGGKGYRAEIAEYVGDWAHHLDAVTPPITIWQGDQDNWVPPAMAQALAAHLPVPTRLELLPGLSHYSALQWYLQRFNPGDSQP